MWGVCKMHLITVSCSLPFFLQRHIFLPHAVLNLILGSMLTHSCVSSGDVLQSLAFKCLNIGAKDVQNGFLKHVWLFQSGKEEQRDLQAENMSWTSVVIQLLCRMNTQGNIGIYVSTTNKILQERFHADKNVVSCNEWNMLRQQRKWTHASDPGLSVPD